MAAICGNAISRGGAALDFGPAIGHYVPVADGCNDL